MLRPRVAPGLVALWLVSLHAHGATDDILVTATRIAQPADELIASAFVIDRAAIESSQARDIGDLLQFHAGIDIGRNGGAGQPASLFMRGTESNHTVVLVDGVKINPGSIGGAAIQNIDPALVDRIEVVKGPRSTLYGSQAIGGVVQIFTRRDTGPGLSSAYAGAGPDGLREAGGGFAFEHGSTGAGVQVSGRRTDGFPTRVGSDIASGFDDLGVNAWLRQRLGEWELDLSHFRSAGNSEYLGFFLEPLDQDFLNATTSLRLRGAPGGLWSQTFTLSDMRDEIDQNQGADFAHTHRTQVDWQADRAIGEDLLTLGAALTRETVRAASFGTVYDEHGDDGSVFAQYQAVRGRHRVLGAARYEHHDGFGSHVTGEIAWRVALSPRVDVSASLANAFRAPDATDRFGFGGNPDLEPETSRQAELGLRWRPHPRHRVRVSAFLDELDNLITFVDPDGYLGPAPGRNQNVERARVTGIEAGYAWQDDHWRIEVEGIVQDPRNRDTGRRLPRRAERSLTVNAEWHAGRARFGAKLLATSERNDSDFSETVNPSYVVIDATCGWTLSRNWRVEARLENVTDEDYVLADGFRTQGRALFVRMRYDAAGHKP